MKRGINEPIVKGNLCPGVKIGEKSQWRKWGKPGRTNQLQVTVYQLQTHLQDSQPETQRQLYPLIFPHSFIGPKTHQFQSWNQSFPPYSYCHCLNLGLISCLKIVMVFQLISMPLRLLSHSNHCNNYLLNHKSDHITFLDKILWWFLNYLLDKILGMALEVLHYQISTYFSNIIFYHSPTHTVL